MQELLSETYKRPVSVSTQLSFTKLLVGNEFWALQKDENFKHGWDALYQSCPWATAFQSREYVTAWYQVFEKKFLPVVVVSQLDGQLTGLLTMAIRMPDTPLDAPHQGKVQIIAAGEYEAEYQVWLATETQGEAFIKEALLLLKDQFPKSDILFRFLPANAPINWITADDAWKNRCVLQEFRRPLLDLQNPAVHKLLHLSRQNKTKYNRLKRKGEVVFEQITDPDQFSTVLQDLAVQYDFRQGVMFNMNQFRDNPLKADFLLRLFKSDLLHVTTLRLENEVVAAMVATKGKNWVHLQGLNTHSPFYAKNSPGILHFFLLGQFLADQGYGVFDLTPGGDSYKERFATAFDQVYSLAVTDSKVYRFKRRLRKHLHARMIKAGHRPMSVELALKKKLYLLRARLKALRKGEWSSITKPTPFHYTGKVPGNPLPAAVNSLQDLLCHEPGGSRATRWEFLEDAMTRFENGQRAYTYATPDQLLACLWLPAPDEKGQQEQPEPQDRTPELTFCQPGFANQLPAFLAGIAASNPEINLNTTTALFTNLCGSKVAHALKTHEFHKTTL